MGRAVIPGGMPRLGAAPDRALASRERSRRCGGAKTVSRKLTLKVPHEVQIGALLPRRPLAAACGMRALPITPSVRTADRGLPTEGACTPQFEGAAPSAGDEWCRRASELGVLAMLIQRARAALAALHHRLLHELRLFVGQTCVLAYSCSRECP